AALGVGPDCLNAMEDARINRFFLEVIDDPEAIDGGGLNARDAIALGGQLAASGSLRAAVLSLLAASSSRRLRSNLEEALLRTAEPLFRKAIELCRKAERLLFARRPPSQAWGERVAQRLESVLGAEGASAAAQGAVARAVLSRLLRDCEDGVDLAEGPGLEADLGADLGPIEGLHRGGPGPGNRWGRLEIDRLPLVRGQGGRLARRWRPALEGVGVRYMHRYGVDRAIFGCRRRVQGGSVLIDASGSMRLSAADVDTLVRATPGATVAAYAGKDDHGHLWILAAGARVADLDAWAAKRCSGNVVDGPALRWLARQEKPRIWVSDGVVTGVGDGAALHLTQESQRIVETGAIRQARNVKDALKVLRRGGRG
ncbi:MAG: hypothetical protein HY721_07695, partial [Planctomycetes bacterium]|nr:hypothetical protein [Planctomycetota bacterium]